MANEKKATEGKAKASARSRAKKPMATAATEAPVGNTPHNPANQQEYVNLEEQIRRRAFQISQSRHDSDPERDWLQAEHEILGKRSA